MYCQFGVYRFEIYSVVFTLIKAHCIVKKLENSVSVSSKGFAQTQLKAVGISEEPSYTHTYCTK